MGAWVFPLAEIAEAGGTKAWRTSKVLKTRGLTLN